MKSWQPLMCMCWVGVAMHLQGEVALAGDDAFHTSDAYRRALAALETSRATPESLADPKAFSALNWVARTATINYLCRMPLESTCKSILRLGLLDNALVVRDHALRVTLGPNSPFLPSEKNAILNQVLVDERNYRKGRPLWIVARAKNHLGKAE